MILPLSHERMTVQRLPWVTIGIITLNVVVFLATWPVAQTDYRRIGEAFEELSRFALARPEVLEDSCTRCPGKAELDELRGRFDEARREHVFSRFGYVPASPTTRGLFGSLFLHAGWMHLLGNMYLLWLCGCSIEDIWGRPLYAAVYVTGGAGAVLAHGFVSPGSTAHLVGASGAIAALMGVFLVRCHDTQIRFFYWFFLTIFGTFLAPAWIMLILWFLREVFYAFVFGPSSSVAFMAHIGGFAYGVAIASVVRLSRIEESFIAPAIERKTNLLSRDPMTASAIAHADTGDFLRAVGDLEAAIRGTPNDSDVHRMLAQCYLRLGRPVEAARALRAELSIHVRRRDHELVAETYRELMSVHPEASLPHREISAVAGALVAMGEPAEAAALYEHLLERSQEPLIRLRAGIALADFFFEEGRAAPARAVLDRLEPLAEPHPEWRGVVSEKRRIFEM